MTEIHSFRIRLLFCGFLVIALLLLGKLYMVQVVHGDTFAQRADRQYALPRASIFDRGTIYFEDKNGSHISAATIESGYIVAINPAALTDAKAIFSKLSALIELNEKDFFVKVAKKDDPYEEIAHRIDKKSADAIKELNLPGVSIFKEQWRMYPGGERAASTLGFVAYDEDQLVGRYGLERYY